jgi:hypothetical protein
MRFYETNKDTEIYVVTEKDRNAYDYSVLSRNMVPPENTYLNDYRSMSSKTIYEKVFENIDRFVTGYNPNWKEDDSKDNYYIVLTTVFNIYGTWEKIDYDMFYSDMSRFISVMTKYKMFMEHISTMFDSTNDCQIVLRKCGEGDYTYVHGGYRHLPMSSWTNKTISIIYTEIFNYGEDMTFTDEQSSSDIHINPTTNMKDVYKIWHKIYFYPDSQEDYLYRPIGYNDLSEHNPKIWCFLYRNDDSKWTYEQINEWFKKHFIDKMNHNNKLNTIGKWDRCNIELFICVNKDTPPRSDKKKSYVYEYEDKLNDYQTLMWRFIYYNEQFVRIGRTSRAYIPKNADDAYDGKD